MTQGDTTLSWRLDLDTRSALDRHSMKVCRRHMVRGLWSVPLFSVLTVAPLLVYLDHLLPTANFAVFRVLQFTVVASMVWTLFHLVISWIDRPKKRSESELEYGVSSSHVRNGSDDIPVQHIWGVVGPQWIGGTPVAWLLCSRNARSVLLPFDSRETAERTLRSLPPTIERVRVAEEEPFDPLELLPIGQGLLVYSVALLVPCLLVEPMLTLSYPDPYPVLYLLGALVVLGPSAWLIAGLSEIDRIRSIPTWSAGAVFNIVGCMVAALLLLAMMIARYPSGAA